MFFLRYTDKTEIMNMISFLDPRTKRPPAISAEEREIIHDKLLDALVYYKHSETAQVHTTCQTLGLLVITVKRSLKLRQKTTSPTF